MVPVALNEDIAGRLDEVARILDEQGASRFRVQAYQQAALMLRGLARPVSEIFAEEGLAGLEQLPGVGESIARAIRELIRYGRLAMLDRLRGEHDPIALLTSVPGIGKAFACKLHDELGIESLEDLENAAHDGRREKLAGTGRSAWRASVTRLAIGWAESASGLRARWSGPRNLPCPSCSTSMPSTDAKRRPAR
jgi:DNA polymerase/3'-5' exonuclease PolX